MLVVQLCVVQHVRSRLVTPVVSHTLIGCSQLNVFSIRDCVNHSPLNRKNCSGNPNCLNHLHSIQTGQ